jgi:Fe-Mn family superoxide dismutase
MTLAAELRRRARVGTGGLVFKKVSTMFELAPLPFEKSALEPVISRRTVEFHYDKHHAGYVKKLNELTKGTPLAKSSLEQVIRATAGDESAREIFNNAAQVWNHDFFWRSMRPGGAPIDAIGEEIKRGFGSPFKFVEQFTAAALHQFGSGWTWLVLDAGKLKIVTTHDAELPMTSNMQALLTCDVWEHAYYLDYQNDREKFVRAFLDQLVDWTAVGSRLEQLMPSH